MKFSQKFLNFYNLEIIGLRFYSLWKWGRPDMFILKYLKTAHQNKKFIFLIKEITIEILLISKMR